MQAIKPLKIRQTIFLIYFITFLSNTQVSLAQTINDANSSSEISIESNLPDNTNSSLQQAQILLSEVNFKNSEEDFLKFKIATTENSLNLKGLEFYDDKVFKTIEQDFFVHNGDQITLYFNLTQPDNISTKELFTDHAGLTGTTEQIIIKQANYYFDFLCWQKAPTSKTEQVDFQKIFHTDFWDNSNINSCFPSASVANNQSILRQNNQHLSQAWTITPQSSTNSETNTTANPITENPETSSTSSNSDESNSDEQAAEYSDEINDTQNTTPRTLTPATYAPTVKKTATIKKSSSKSSSSTSLALQIADFGPDQVPEDQPIIITEIMPAPAKTTGSTENSEEWIELFNQSDQNINLKNWIIDDSDGGSKPHPLDTQVFPSNTYLVLKASETKLNLNNSSDQVRLFNSENNLIDAIAYQEAEKNSSYARITIDDQVEWSWQKVPTPGKANPNFISLSGTISSAPVFEQIYHFQIQTSDTPSLTYTINFDESTVKAPLAKNIFTIGTTGKFIGQLINKDLSQGTLSSDQPTLQLHQYQLSETAPNTENNSLPTIIIATIMTVVVAIYFFVKHRRKWTSGLFGKSPSPS